jgi:hypothetical protein
MKHKGIRLLWAVLLLLVVAWALNRKPAAMKRKPVAVCGKKN